MNILMRMLPLIITEKYNNPVEKKIKVFLTKDSVAEFVDIALTNTMHDFVVRGITKDMFNKKLKEWKEKQTDLELQMSSYTIADESFYVNANILLQAVKKASQVFENSEPTTKRQILNFLLQNLKLDGKKLDFQLKTPFDGVLKANTSSNLLRG